MNLDPGELEGLADELNEQGGGDADDPASLMQIARARRIIVERSRLPVGGASRGVFEGRTRILLRRMPEVPQRFHFAHELAEDKLDEIDYRGEDVERCANYIAAALLAPRKVFTRAMNYGLTRSQLAREFLVTETHAVLRMSELTGEPRVVVCRDHLHARGSRSFIFPPEPQLVKLAIGRLVPGVYRAKLRDDRTRTVLRFADVA